MRRAARRHGSHASCCGTCRTRLVAGMCARVAAATCRCGNSSSTDTCRCSTRARARTACAWQSSQVFVAGMCRTACRRGRAVMHLKQPLVIRRARTAGDHGARAMTVVALLAGGNVAGRLAARAIAVVATVARAQRLCVVHARDRHPRARHMTRVAIVGREAVVRMLERRADSASLAVATAALQRRAGELAVDVTALAGRRTDARLRAETPS